MRKLAFLFLMMLFMPTLGVVSCSDEGSEDSRVEEGKAEDDGKLVDGKSDAWNYTNNPSRFQQQFEYKFEDLPLSGTAAQMPWPDTYWPSYQDSSNVRWKRGELSPMEKYDKAFNSWTPSEGFMELRPFDSDRCGDEDSYDMEYYEEIGPAALWQTKNNGMYRMVDRVDNDRDGKTDECPISGDEDNDDYDGIQGWWGLCHAWVPAAILEPEPQRSVTYNGVTFHVADVKGLLQTVYNNSDAVMLGGRCNERKVEFDEFGRAKLDQCRDTNPGSFHVVVTNMLGRFERAFAEDKTYDFQVWNQPITKYEVLSHEEVTAKEANDALGFEGDEYHFMDRYAEDERPVRFFKVRTKLYYITESAAEEGPLVNNIERYTRSDTYDYILEADEDGRISGGEWIGYTARSHPDFLWLPLSISRNRRGANPYIKYEKVKMLIEMSLQPEDPEDPEEPGEFKTFESEGEIPIPDDNETGIVSVIDVPDDLEIASLKVEVEIEHTYIGDLKVVLEKDGVKAVLHDQQGGGANDLVETFSVHDFDGTGTKGTWRLHVSDHAGRDVGKLIKWALLVSSGDSGPAGNTLLFSSTERTEIPDNDSAGISSIISVNDTGVIEKVEVSLELTHTYIGDLVVVVEHGGSSQVLHSREGGSRDDIDKTYTLSAFNGGPLKGDWTLKIADKAGQDTGALDEWSISVAVRP